MKSYILKLKYYLQTHHMFFGALISKTIHIQRLKMAKYNNYSFHLGQNY